MNQTGKNSKTLTYPEIKTPDEEKHWVLMAKKDPFAFGELYHLYVERVFNYLYGRLGNVQDAEDITSQTFLTALEALDGFRQDGCFAAWLFTIARNKTMDHFRRHKNSYLNQSSPPDSSEIIDPLSEIIQSEQSAELRVLIQALDEDEQELLRLRYLAGLTYAEIAGILGRKEDAVKKTHYRLLARLQSQMEVPNE